MDVASPMILPPPESIIPIDAHQFCELFPQPLLPQPALAQTSCTMPAGHVGSRESAGHWSLAWHVLTMSLTRGVWNATKGIIENMCTWTEMSGAYCQQHERNGCVSNRVEWLGATVAALTMLSYWR